MNIDECFELGYIIKPHGLKGTVDIFLDTDYPGDYTELESVFVKVGQKLVPFFISRIQIRGNKALVHFEDIDTLEQSEELKGCSLYLPDSMLPQLEGEEFYFHEVLGFQVSDSQMGKLGHITKFYDYPGQTLLAVDFKEKEILIPVNDDIITKVDRKEKLIEVSLPDGLVDVYIDS